MVKNSPAKRKREESTCNAGDMGLIPGQGAEIPHAFEQLRSHAATIEPKCLEPTLRNKRSHCNEKPTHCNKEQPSLVATRESPCEATEDPAQPKIKLIENKIIYQMHKHYYAV